MNLRVMLGNNSYGTLRVSKSFCSITIQRQCVKKALAPPRTRNQGGEFS